MNETDRAYLQRQLSKGLRRRKPRTEFGHATSASKRSEQRRFLAFIRCHCEAIACRLVLHMPFTRCSRKEPCLPGLALLCFSVCHFRTPQTCWLSPCLKHSSQLCLVCCKAKRQVCPQPLLPDMNRQFSQCSARMPHRCARDNHLAAVQDGRLHDEQQPAGGPAGYHAQPATAAQAAASACDQVSLSYGVIIVFLGCTLFKQRLNPASTPLSLRVCMAISHPAVCCLASPLLQYGVV